MKCQFLPFHGCCEALGRIRRTEVFHAQHEYFSARSLEAIRGWQIAQGRYSSVSEYIRELIRADERRMAEEQLDAKLPEGSSSGESELTSGDWCAIRNEALAKIEARRLLR